MATEWKLFADLAECAGDKRVTVQAEPGDTVGDALDALLTAYPDLADRVQTDTGDLRAEINLLHEGTNVHAAGEGLTTELEGDDELALFPPVSGG